MEIIQSKQVRQEIQSLLDEHQVLREKYSMEVFRCNKCNRLDNRLSAELAYDDGQKYKAVYEFPKCQESLRKIDIS